jgi:hypothetical protein
VGGGATAARAGVEGRGGAADGPRVLGTGVPGWPGAPDGAGAGVPTDPAGEGGACASAGAAGGGLGGAGAGGSEEPEGAVARAALATEGSIIIARMSAVALAIAAQDAPRSSRTCASAFRVSMRTRKPLLSRETDATTSIGSAGRAVRLPSSRSTFAMIWASPGHSAGALQSSEMPVSPGAWEVISAAARASEALASAAFARRVGG